MKKSVRFLLSATLLLISISGVQASGLGIRGGFNFSSIPSSQEVQFGVNGWGSRTMEALSDSYTGYHFGVVGHVSFLGLFIQPEFLFIQTGQEMVLHAQNDLPEGESDSQFFTQEFNHLSLPVVAGLNIGPLRVGIGPVASYMIDRTSGYIPEEDNGISFGYNDWTVGYQALVGLKVGNFLVDLKYEGNLSDFGDSMEVAGREFNFDTRPNQFIVSIGLLIF
ncbi:MAG: outer membrane beta-barrel protein [Bacteroidales bacterium]